MLITNLVNLYAKKLNAVGIKNSLEEIRLMIQEILKIDLATQLIKKEIIINEKQENLIKEYSKKSEKLNQIIKCPMSRYKDNCQGEETYNNGTYNGLFKNDKRHGHGTYNFKIIYVLIKKIRKAITKP